MGIIQLFIPLILIAIGLITGKLIETRHLRRLSIRESGLNQITRCNLRNIPKELKVKETFLVMGSVVIATDYFKIFAAALRNLFGGEIKAYRSLMDRARREALIRMLEKANNLGADSIWNIRYETSTIQGKRRPGGVEVLAYGTGVKI